MGIQSQNCNGSIEAAKKRGTKIKRPKQQLLQVQVGGSLPFLPTFHCKRCRITQFGSAVLEKYHGGHHDHCGERTKNKKNKATPQSNTMFDYTTNVCCAAAATAAPQRKKKAPPINVIAGSVGYNTQHLNSMGIDSDFVLDMKRSIDERMDELEHNQKPSWALSQQAPPRMIIATDLILSHFEHRRLQSADCVLPQTKGFCTAMTADNALGVHPLYFHKTQATVKARSIIAFQGTKSYMLTGSLLFRTSVCHFQSAPAVLWSILKGTSKRIQEVYFQFGDMMAPLHGRLS
ncbi:unnamed protein product [Cylindrotheca closterium]|uniref:Uncharacterized protein n=1 Tax=Cylindrotheca closterium TaxID=2856 RepID=A0AAD2FBU0_9STRA|nr:unnamed protein product [Cylindrotheca closterium]